MVKIFELKNGESNFSIKKKGKYLFFLFNLSGNLQFNIESENCQIFIYGLFLGKDRDEFQLRTIQEHKVGNNFSELFIKGIFLDKARFSFQGLIRIDKGADKSFAYQKNQNLVLSKDCLVESQPYLEILSNDVYCTHGSTTGSLDEEEIFYLNSRGFSRKESSLILVEGFLKEIFEKINKILGEKKGSQFYKKYQKIIKKYVSD